MHQMVYYFLSALYLTVVSHDGFFEITPVTYKVNNFSLNNNTPSVYSRYIIRVAKCFSVDL